MLFAGGAPFDLDQASRSFGWGDGHGCREVGLHNPRHDVRSPKASLRWGASIRQSVRHDGRRALQREHGHDRADSCTAANCMHEPQCYSIASSARASDRAAPIVVTSIDTTSHGATRMAVNATVDTTSSHAGAPVSHGLRLINC